VSTTTAPTSLPVRTSLELVLRENVALMSRILDSDRVRAELTAAADAIGTARSVFFLGAGRSGLALRMTAMRIMHLGLDAYVVGEVTTPAIGQGDVLLVASGSGTTSSILRAAATAAEAGAGVVAVTTDAGSPLAQVAEICVVLPAAQKEDHDGGASAQYAGSLFEQGVLLVGDGLFHALWQASGSSAHELWPRHANLE